MEKLAFHIRALISFALCIAITGVSLFFIMDAQRARTIELSELAAQRQTRLLQSMIDNDINAINATAIFFQATDPHEWYHFPEFQEGLINRSDGLIAVEWMQKVERGELNSHLRRVRREFPQAKLYTSTDDEGLIHGMHDAMPEQLYIASDIYPRTPANAKVIGFYPSKERFQKVLSSIRVKKEPNLSDKVTLLQDDIHNTEPADGFLVYYPVFERDNESLKGVIIGVLRASVYFDYLVSQTLEGKSVAVKIVDTGFSAADDPILYESSSWQSPSFYEYSDFVSFSNRTWTINYRFRQEWVLSDRVSLFFVAFAGIIASLFVSAMVNESITKQDRLEKELRKRTRDLNYLVNHDAQTGTLNRRAFNEMYRQYIESGESFSLITFDIDNFKQINDNYGHPVGDAALKHIAGIVGDKLNGSDKLFRIGGDEFSILSKKSEAGELKGYLITILNSVSSTPLKRREEIFMSISIGAAVCRGHAADELTHIVDSELYRSKSLGRNRVSILKS